MEYTEEYIDGRRVVIVDGPIILGQGGSLHDIHIKFSKPQPVKIEGYGLIENIVIDRQPNE